MISWTKCQDVNFILSFLEWITRSSSEFFEEIKLVVTFNWIFHVSEFWRSIILFLARKVQFYLDIHLVINFYFYHYYFHIQYNCSRSIKILISLIILSLLNLSFVSFFSNFFLFFSSVLKSVQISLITLSLIPVFILFNIKEFLNLFCFLVYLIFFLSPTLFVLVYLS